MKRERRDGGKKGAGRGVVRRKGGRERRVEGRERKRGEGEEKE